MKLRFWRKPHEDILEEEATTKETGEPCPICVHLNKFYGDTPIKTVTHGAGNPDGEWLACYDHYKVISGFEWLVLTRQINYRFARSY